MICIARGWLIAQWLEHSPRSQVDSHEDSASWGLCPHVILMTLVNSLTWSTCVGRGRAEEGVEHRFKTQIWSNHFLAHVVKFRLGELPGPTLFSSLQPTNACHEPSTEAIPAPWGTNHLTLPVSVSAMNSFSLEPLLLFSWWTSCYFPRDSSYVTVSMKSPG